MAFVWTHKNSRSAGLDPAARKKPGGLSELSILLAERCQVTGPKCLPLRGYAKVVEKERVDVRRLFQLLGSAAGAVAGFCIDADDDRIVAGLGGLQRRGVFERMSRHDAIVMVGGGDQDGWIPGSSLHVVNG